MSFAVFPSSDVDGRGSGPPEFGTAQNSGQEDAEDLGKDPLRISGPGGLPRVRA